MLISRLIVPEYNLRGTIGTLATGRGTSLFLKHALYDNIETLLGICNFEVRNRRNINPSIPVPVRPITVAGCLLKE